MNSVLRILRTPFQCFMNMKLFRKFLAIYIVVILLPTLILETLLYRQNISFIRQQYLQSASNALEVSEKNLNTETSNIEACVNYMSSSKTLIHYLNGFCHSEAEELYYYIKEIQPMLKYIVNSNPAILSVDFYGYSDYRLEWSGRLHYAKDLAFPPDMPSDLRSLSLGVWYPVPDNTDRITYYQYLYDADYKAPAAVIEIQISLGYLMKSFSSLNGSVYFSRPGDPVLMRYGGESAQKKEITVSDLTRTELEKDPSVCRIPADRIGLSVYLVPEPLPSMNYSSRLLLTALLTLLLISAGFYLSIVISISRRISVLQEHISKSRVDSLVPLQHSEYTDEIGLLTTSYNEMIRRINDLLFQIYNTELQKRDAEFYALQAQIEPHFLYNILENIHMSAELSHDYKTAAMVTSLGKFMRYNLNTNTGISTLTEELMHARNYLDIHKVRMQDKLNVIISAFTDLEDIKCPRFILQPLLENSLKHADAGNLPLTIEITVCDRFEGETDGDVVLRIQDNGNGISESELQHLRQSMKEDSYIRNQHIGLNSINSRMQAFFGKEYALQVESGPGRGFAVIMYLKRMGADSHEDHDR